MQVLPHMQVDPELLDARARDMRRMAGEVRSHIDVMRGLPAAQLASRMMEHTAQVARMQSTVTRHTTDMYQRFEMDEAEVAMHFGMRPEEHREFMGELQRVREEAGRLQVEPQVTRERRMPAHLDRLEAVAARLEEGATRMAGVTR